MGAWYFSFGFLSYIRAAVRICIAEGNFSTKSILQKINAVVYHDPVVNDVLSSLSLVMVDTQEGTLTYSGAGDLPLLYYNALNGDLKQIGSSGMLLGLMPDGDFDEQVLKLNTGDRLFIFTDGIIDFEDTDGKKTDYDTFTRAVTPYLNQPFAAIKQGDFLQDKTLTHIDDCSLIHLQKKDQ
jgi:sigma-B regulation protein RsbU (phosphoserine phosphatase)